jgi:hypothetical protein
LEELFYWLVRKYGEAVLSWSVQQLMDRLARDNVEPPGELHGASCECHECGIVYDDDELGIDPESEAYG